MPCHGAGYEFAAQAVAQQFGEFVDKVLILPFREGYSTTGIIERIKQLVQEGKL